MSLAMAGLKKNVNELQRNINDVSVTIELLKGSLDRKEQYPRRNCLLIHGLPESRNKNTDELGIDQSRKRWEKK